MTRALELGLLCSNDGLVSLQLGHRYEVHLKKRIGARQRLPVLQKNALFETYVRIGHGYGLGLGRS